MVKNILVLRFANIFFSAVWSNAFINNVQITFKETIGVEGRGGYFDSYGIIRDVMQNHLVQILSLIAMEQPASIDPEHIRDAKVRVLRQVKPLLPRDCLLGQYIGANGKAGYLECDVPQNSRTPTFAACVFYVDNDRWRNVPFILKCGKALNEQKAEIRIQFNDFGCDLLHCRDLSRNELVIRVQPNEAVYMKFNAKKPGLAMDTITSELDLSYKSRYAQLRIPDAYESLILDIFKGDHSDFVRSDELDAAWAIFDNVLKADSNPLPYEYGSRGPAALDDFVKSFGYVRNEKYIWHPKL